MGEVILTMKDIDKSFVGVYALKNACLELGKDEVHALMSGNGAGESTLMEILTGVYSRNSGTTVCEGRQMEFRSPREAQGADIMIVHQGLSMMSHLTVAQSIFTGEGKMNGKLINDCGTTEETEELFELLNIRTDPRETMRRLTVGRQRMCEIAEAISTDAKVTVFDKPTAALTDSRISELLKIIRDLRVKDTGITYISHRMDEINQITDRVMVMKDGGYVSTLTAKDSTKDDIIQMMVGHAVYEEPKSFSNIKSSASVVLKVGHLNVGKTIKDISFELRKGEILGFPGPMEAGGAETVRTTFSTSRRDSGDVYVNGKRVDIKSPQDAADAGIGYLSEDHKHYGVIIEKAVTENATMASLKAFCKGLSIGKKAEKETAEQYAETLKTEIPSVGQQVCSLSGDNQQKVVIAKWLTRDCDILIFDEPAREIGVGTKSETYILMSNLVKQGRSIIMISSELAEVLRMSDRILTMCEGHKTGGISIEEATQEEIMHAAILRD